MHMMQLATVKGTRNIFRGLVIIVIIDLLMIAITYYVYTIASRLADLSDPTGQNFQDAFNAVIPLLGACCGIGLLALFGLLLILLGFMAFHRGKAEYGAEHSKNIDRAVLLFVFIIVVVVMTFISGMSAGVGGLATTTSVLTVVSIALGLVQAGLIAFFLFYLIKAFIPQESMNIAILAMGLYIASPAVSAVASALFAIPSDYFTNPGSFVFDPLWIIPSVLGALIGIFGLILFILLYYQVQIRLTSRTIPPIWEQSMQYVGQQQPPEMKWQPPPQQ